MYYVCILYTYLLIKTFIHLPVMMARLPRAIAMTHLSSRAPEL